MEKQPHQEYRDELADKLKEIRNSDPENPEVAKAKAIGYLDAKQETEEYQVAKERYSNTVEINGQKIEIGPAVGRLGEKFQSRYVELQIENWNKRLSSGESPWRLFTNNELEEISKSIKKILDDQSISEEERNKKAQEYLEEFGLMLHESYWFNLKDNKNLDGNRSCWDSKDGFFEPLYSNYEALIKLVR